MKNIFKTFVIAILIAAPVILFAQTPPHPNGGGAPNGGNTPVGGGAPIGGGLIIMMVMGAAYGAKNTFKTKSIKKILE